MFSHDLPQGRAFFKYFERTLTRKRTKLGAASKSQGLCSSRWFLVSDLEKSLVLKESLHSSNVLKGQAIA